MTEERFSPMFPTNKTFTTEFRGVRYEYYLTGEIGPAEDYVDLCNILRTASEQDEVILRIRSGGGSVHTGNMIINAINESEANVVGFIESDCGSMATFIFLACNTWGVSDTAEFFCHSCSYGSWGKEHENFTQAEFIRKQSHKQMRQRYSNFLTEEEIERVISGTDIYLDAEEIMERLQTYADARQSQPCDCGASDCPDSQADEDEIQEFNLESMIEESVEAGVNKALDKLMRKYTLVPKEPKSKPVKPKPPEVLQVQNEKVINQEE